MTDSAQTSYSACAGISWVVEDDGVRVIDEIAHRSEILTGAEAALWELLLRGHQRAETVGMLQWAIGAPPEKAEGLTTDCLRAWLEAGWLQEADSGGEW